LLFAEGQGVPQDYMKARQWYEQAAAQGNAGAQSNLGWMYFNGQGVPQDYTTARGWYEKAAAQGDVWSQVNLGLLYVEGNGVPQNDVRAYMWWSLAAASTGDEQKLAVDNRDEVARRMTSAQIAEGLRLAQQCQAQNFKGC
jgi:TPR repeat protein